MSILPRPRQWFILLGSLVLVLLATFAVPRTMAQRALPRRPVTPSCFVQVSSPNPGAGENYLNGVSTLPSGDAWAVGSFTNGAPNQPLTLRWDGLNWVVSASPSIPTGTLNGVSAVDANDVWAVGSYSPGIAQTLTMHWDGTAWSQVPSPNPSSSENVLFSVAALSSTDAWAVGRLKNGTNYYQTLTLHWDGSTWSQVASPNPGPSDNLLFGVSAVAADDVWAVGWYTIGGVDQTLVLHWNGTAWTQVPSPDPGVGPNLLSAVSAVAANNAWAVGFSNPGTLVLHWDGTTWSQVPSPNPGSSVSLNGVSALPAGDVWVVGSYANGGPRQTLVMHWDGLAWAQVPSPNVGNHDNALQSVSAVSASDIRTAGSYSTGTTNLTLILHACPDATATAAAQTPTASSTQTATLTVAVPSPTRTATMLPTGTPTRTATVLLTSTPPATPTIGAYCANVAWTDKINTSVNNGTLVKSGGQDGHWDAGAVSTLAILTAPACYRIDGGLVTLGSTRVFGLTHHETSPGYDDIDYGIYLAADGALGVVDQGQLPAGNWGSYTAGDSFQIAIEGPQGTTVNYYHNNIVFYTSAHPPQLPLFGDAAIATLEGDIAPSRICSNGPPRTTPTPSETPCPLTFVDVMPTDYFATPVRYLACHGVISGYANSTFRPYNNTTRSQMVKIVVLGFSVPLTTPPAGGFTFTDVPPGYPFFTFIETAAARQIVSGYNCGGMGEPCDTQHRPYFRPYANVTRGQLAKIAIGGAGWPAVNPVSPTFADVSPGSAFYVFVETAVCHRIISGYGCGGPGEPCDPGNRPYFRQAHSATRGQIAKIIYGAVTSQAPCPLRR